MQSESPFSQGMKKLQCSAEFGDENSASWLAVSTSKVGNGATRIAPLRLWKNIVFTEDLRQTKQVDSQYL